MKVIVYTFCQSILARVDIFIRISLHNYLVGQIIVTVFLHFVNQFLKALIIASGFHCTII